MITTFGFKKKKKKKKKSGNHDIRSYCCQTKNSCLNTIPLLANKNSCLNTKFQRSSCFNTLKPASEIGCSLGSGTLQ